MSQKGSPHDTVGHRLAHRCFRTEFGWCGVAATSQGLVALRFGERHYDSIRRWLGELLNSVQLAGGQNFNHKLAKSPKRSRSASGFDESDLDHVVLLVQQYFCGVPVDFRATPIDWATIAPTPFQRKVLHACGQIPYGQVCTYSQLAAAVGSPGAARAVGSVMSRNWLPIVIPCHRVVGSRGKLTGYSAPGGIAMKEALLKMEHAGLSRQPLSPRVSSVLLDDMSRLAPDQANIS